MACVLIFDFALFLLTLCCAFCARGVLVVFVGVCFGILFLGSLCLYYSSVVIMIRFYLFVGGIMCVCGFFCSFFWRFGFVSSNAWLVPIFLLTFGFVILESVKFLGLGVLESGSIWLPFWLELCLGISCLLIALIIIWVFVQG